MYYCPCCQTAYDYKLISKLPRAKLKKTNEIVGYQCPTHSCYGVILNIDEMMIPVVDYLIKVFNVVTLFCCSGHYIRESPQSTYIMLKYDEKNPFISEILEINTRANDDFLALTLDKETSKIMKETKVSIEVDEFESSYPYMGSDGVEYELSKTITLRMPIRYLGDYINNLTKDMIDDTGSSDINIIKTMAKERLWHDILTDQMNLLKFLKYIHDRRIKN